MTGRIKFTPEAERQLNDLDDWIAEAAAADIARGFFSAVLGHIDGILVFPRAGRARDDVRPGMRMTSFKKRTLVAYEVDESSGSSSSTSLTSSTVARTGRPRLARARSMRTRAADRKASANESERNGRAARSTPGDPAPARVPCDHPRPGTDVGRQPGCRLVRARDGGAMAGRACRSSRGAGGAHGSSWSRSRASPRAWACSARTAVRPWRRPRRPAGPARAARARRRRCASRSARW